MSSSIRNVDLKNRKNSNVRKCLIHLKDIETMTSEMLSKYRRQVADIEADVKHGLKRGYNKQSLITKLRRKKIITHHITQCEQKIDVLVQKQYQLEQLNITIMQIDALRDTTKIMKNFTKTNNIEKIEQLTDTMNELQDNIMDINESLNTDILDFDDNELEDELNELNRSDPNIIATFPVVPQDEILSPEAIEKQRLIPEQI